MYLVLFSGSALMIAACQKNLKQEIIDNLPTQIFLDSARDQSCRLFETNLQRIRQGKPILDTGRVSSSENPVG
ncbi:MAG: hypothetical protein RLZZ628_4145, partial [Bacteroidota bacterium]